MSARRVCLWGVVFLCVVSVCQAGRQMPKLSNKKMCADAECSHPILIARALEDYYPGDCRFISLRQGQVVYVYALLKDRGNMFWAGSVQGSYYGEQEARLGHFPSSVVEETHALMPATNEVMTDVGGHTNTHTNKYTNTHAHTHIMNNFSAKSIDIEY
uniref:SH3 domain-containing protein n=1 Tax=Oncorhynchus mykiss TaxID=8022 RepID=A0A8L0DJK7_ONCMY